MKGPISVRYAPGLLEVTYGIRNVNAGGRLRDLSNSVDGRIAHVLGTSVDGEQAAIISVKPGDEMRAITRLRADPVVKGVNRSALRFLQSTTAVEPNDPFFAGIAPATNTPPLYQTANVGGQWDTHVICSANAWGYGNSNSTGNLYAGALGGTARIAIIDTGADLTHPELANRAVYAESVINGTVTVGLGTMHDNDGHGTNVAGIAAASANNSLGFAGVAYKAPLLIFRVFPDPPCSGGCAASGADVGIAITDAVSNGANVISLSIGAAGPDPAEESAVGAAIARGVVVVAASGNETSSTLDYPAADPGVIAVGASALDDSTPGSIAETVASYSNYKATDPQWGLVAPGGDPTGNNDPDTLHWIENVYTSTAANSAAACRPDPGSSASIIDCRTLIAGTSQATPHVAGAVALMLSVNAALTPTQVKNALCTSARPLTTVRAGCGRLDVYRALAQIIGDNNP